MTERDEQLERLRTAVDRKSADAKAASEATHPDNPSGPNIAADIQADIETTGRPQDAFSVRDKNAGKGKKTADKWNQ